MVQIFNQENEPGHSLTCTMQLYIFNPMCKLAIYYTYTMPILCRCAMTIFITMNIVTTNRVITKQYWVVTALLLFKIELIVELPLVQVKGINNWQIQFQQFILYKRLLYTHSILESPYHYPQ